MAEIDRIEHRLRADIEHDARLGLNSRMHAEIRLLLDELSRLRGREEEYRKALEPFADIAPCVEYTDQRDGQVVHRQRVIVDGEHHGWKELTKDDFRRAAGALDPTRQKGEAG